MSAFRHFRRLSVALAAVVAHPAGAQTAVQDLEALDSQIAAFLGARAGEPGGAASSIDRRLRLAACPDRVELSRQNPRNLVLSCPALGWRIRVPLASGSANSGHAGVAPPTPATALVTRGDQVQLLVRRGAVMVTATGVALDSGGQGDRVRIRIGSNRSPIAGFVMRDGRVSANPLNFDPALP